MPLHALALVAGAALAAQAAPSAALECPAGTVRQEVRAERSRTEMCVRLGGSAQFGEPVLDGPYRAFHPNGQLHYEGRYKDGEREGRWTYFTPAGRKEFEADYARGKLDGARTEFQANGQPRVREQFQRGLRHGPVVRYDEAGKVVQTLEYDQGNRVDAGAKPGAPDAGTRAP